MSLPLDVITDLAMVLNKHGVRTIGHAELNALIAALTPCFEEGYLK